MGVYIKGMEMPPSCRYCEFRHMSITQNAFCTAAHETIDYMAERTKRHPDCPLIPVPPHGDLIDRNVLIEPRRISKYYHLPNGDTAIPIIDIEHAPTVISSDAYDVEEQTFTDEYNYDEEEEET